MRSLVETLPVIPHTRSGRPDWSPVPMPALYSVRAMGSNGASPNPVRCLHVLQSTELGGAETRARELLGGLARTPGVEPELVYFTRGRAHARFEELGIPLRQIEKRTRLALDFPRIGWRLRRLYAANPPDILHTWLVSGNAIGLFAARGWPNARVVITQCGGPAEAFASNPLRVQRALIGRADHAISNSDDGTAFLESLGMPASKISVVLNGIAPERVAVARDRDAVREELGIDRSTPLVAAVSRLGDRIAVRQKNLDGLLDSISTVRRGHPDANLILIGPTEEELADAGFAVPDWVRVTGFVDDPSTYLAAADVVTIPSVAEGMSNVACEALMLGVPVVTTDTGGHVPIVEEAGGVAVAVGSNDSLAEGIGSMLDGPPAPEDVRAVARRRLGLERMVQETVDIYRGVLTARGAAAPA